MFSNVRSQMDEIPSTQMIIADVRVRASPVVNEILSPVGSLPAETNGLDFASVLELLGDAYNKKLCTLRRAEEEALSSFHETYRDYLKGKKEGIQPDRSTEDNEYLDNYKALSEPLNLFYDNSNEFEVDSFDNHLEIAVNNGASDSNGNTLNPNCTPYKDLSSKFPEVFHHADESREIWQKKVTVTQPFQMTLRDEDKRLKPKRRNSLHSDSKITPIQFHSNPVPAHVHLPMYKLITEKSEKFRQDRIDTRKHKMLAEVKPFHLSFENRPATGVLRRSKSLSNLHSGSPHFKASPFPQHIFDNPTKNEEVFLENLRKIRIKSRAEELIKISSLPFTGEKILNRCNSFGSLNRKNISKQEWIEKSPPVKREVSKNVPKAEVLANKSEMRHRNCIPNYTQVLLKQNTRKQLCSTPLAEKTLGYKLTKTAILRQEKNRQEQDKSTRNQRQELAEQSSRISAQNRLQRELILKVKMNCQMPSTKEEIRAKLIAHRKSQYTRTEEYLQEIRDMKSRIEKRPLLIEHQVQQAARNAATKRLQAGAPLARWVVSQTTQDSYEENSPQDHQSTQDTNSHTEQNSYSESEKFEDEQSVGDTSHVSYNSESEYT